MGGLGLGNANIKYSGLGLAQFFTGYRDKWEDFYPSEHWAFEKIIAIRKTFGRVLDVGCGMGGLGLGLSSRCPMRSYLGVDINAQVIAAAQTLKARFKVPAQFKCCDILEAKGVPKAAFDTVFSLSCADWNIETGKIIGRCWQYVKPGGFFVISLRLSPGPGINNIKKSYQPFAWDEKGRPAEIANYVVFNAGAFWRMVEGFQPRPSHVYGYGYWGPPSKTAVTPYKKLVFGVIVIQKILSRARPGPIEAHLNFPLDLFHHAQGQT